MSSGFNEPAGLLLLLLLMRVPLSHEKDFLHSLVNLLQIRIHSLVNLLRIRKLSLLHLLPARGAQVCSFYSSQTDSDSATVRCRMCRVRICNCDQYVEILKLEKNTLNNEYCFYRNMDKISIQAVNFELQMWDIS